jgi:hypothetical protein
VRHRAKFITLCSQESAPFRSSPFPTEARLDGTLDTTDLTFSRKLGRARYRAAVTFPTTRYRPLRAGTRRRIGKTLGDYS